MNSKLYALFLILSFFITTGNSRLIFYKNMSKIASYSNQSTLVIVGLVLVLSIAIVLSLYKKEEFNLKNLQQKSWEKNLKNHD